MKQNLVVIVIAVAAAVAAAMVTASLTSGGDSARAADAVADPRMQRIEESLARLTDSVAKLESAPASLAAPTRIDESAIDRAARQLIAERAAELEKHASAGSAGGDDAASAPEEDLDVSDAIAELTRAGTSHDRKRELWKALANAGKLDEAIDALKEMAENDPTNPELRVDIGWAYVEKLQNVADGPQKGMLAMGADQAFDEALKIDPNHWEARFTKAVSLSFWPPLFGKQAEAVKQFETLVSQQEQRGDRQDHYAQTYLYLGNLYMQQGNAEKAQQAWRQGAALFPNNAELKAKMR